MFKNEYFFLLGNLTLIILLIVVLWIDFVEFNYSLNFFKDLTLLTPFTIIVLSFVSTIFYTKKVKQLTTNKYLIKGNILFSIVLVVATTFALYSLINSTSLNHLIDNYLFRFITVIVFLIFGLISLIKSFK